MQHIENEITESVFLCNRKGQLNPEAIGFARHPLIQANLKRNFMKKKKWNQWAVFGEDILFSATIWHLDYAAVCHICFYHYETQRFFERDLYIPKRRLKLMDDPHSSCSFKYDGIRFKAIYENNETKLTIQMDDFDNEKLKTEIYIYHPPEDESLNVVIPKNRNIFHYTSKHLTLPTTGFVKLGDKYYQFNSDYCFTLFNFNRGIWPRKTNWNLAIASQRLGQNRIGLNLGNEWTDGTGMTENAIFIDGKMFKIHEDLTFTYNVEQLTKPWIIRTKFSNHVHLTFTPFFKKHAKTNRSLFRTDANQLVGYFDGSITLPNAPPLTIRQMLGCTERYQAKW